MKRCMQWYVLHFFLASHPEEEVDSRQRHPVKKLLPVVPRVPFFCAHFRVVLLWVVVDKETYIFSTTDLKRHGVIHATASPHAQEYAHAHAHAPKSNGMCDEKEDGDMIYFLKRSRLFPLPVNDAYNLPNQRVGVGAHVHHVRPRGVPFDGDCLANLWPSARDEKV